MMTAQGAASIDLEDKSAAIVSSTLQLNGQNCPLDSTFLNELDGVVYVVCVNGTSFAHLLKVNVGERSASISVSLPILELALDERLQIVSMSPDRRHSMIYLLHTDSQSNVVALYVVHSDPGASGALQISAGYNQNDIARVKFWAGVDTNFVYTLEGDDSNVFLAKRDPANLKLVSSSKFNFTTSSVVSAAVDAGTPQVVVWTQGGVYAFQNLDNINTTSFYCNRAPTKESCGNWKLTGNSVIFGGSFYAAGTCQTQSATFNVVLRVLLSSNDGCPSHCSGHGFCFNSTCLCFDKYSGSDCSRGGGKANGCGIPCEKNADCLVDPPWNFCPVCYKGKCQPVCTTPCETSSQCQEWGSHSVLSQCTVCASYKHCVVPMKD
jgi:hypothetical protein